MWNLGLLGAAGSAPAYASSMEYLGEALSVTGSETTLSFTSGGSWSNYDHLQFRINARTSNYNIVGGDWLQVKLNNSSSGTSHAYLAAGAGISASQFSGDSDGLIMYAACLATNDTANFMAFTTLDFFDINSSNPKVWKSIGGSAASGYPRINLLSGIFTAVTSPITSISFTPDSGSQFATSSRITAYGIKR
jgi:hypothetical protein